MNRTPDVVACFACLHEKGIRREEIMSTPRKKNRKNCESCPTQVSWKCQSRLSFLSFLTCLWYFSPDLVAKFLPQNDLLEGSQ